VYAVMRLSLRTGFSREPTALSLAVERARASGRPLTDLTSGNPTSCGLGDRTDDVRALGDASGARYAPDAFGLESARQAVARYYGERSRDVSADQIVLTSSTSEAYAWLFKLLCDPGNVVLAPRPSYPLFPYIAELEHVVLEPYSLLRDERWRLDIGGMRRRLADGGVRAVMLVHPGNPTGTFIHPADAATLSELAVEHDFALIVDEVFLDYAEGGASFAGNDDANTFVLSGLSKVALLPQVKLGWMVISGPDADEARARLEIIADTFLSVSTAVQLACPALLETAAAARHAALTRIRDNRNIVDAVIARTPPLRQIPSDGGWYACIEVPRTRGDDAWCEHLVEKEGIIVHPGHFFDMEERGVMVLSLLSEDFAEPFERAARLWARS
jgi:aspartate/methionine/tyrosine aminotransferase